MYVLIWAADLKAVMGYEGKNRDSQRCIYKLSCTYKTSLKNCQHTQQAVAINITQNEHILQIHRMYNKVNTM